MGRTRTPKDSNVMVSIIENLQRITVEHRPLLMPILTRQIGIGFASSIPSHLLLIFVTLLPKSALTTTIMIRCVDAPYYP